MHRVVFHKKMIRLCETKVEGNNPSDLDPRIVLTFKRSGLLLTVSQNLKHTNSTRKFRFCISHQTRENFFVSKFGIIWICYKQQENKNFVFCRNFFNCCIQLINVHFKAYDTTNSKLFEFLKYLERFPRYLKNKKNRKILKLRFFKKIGHFKKF